jgi:hypothetical protein
VGDLADSPKLRDSNPSVVVVPGLGLFGFGKNKKEARITTEFFINAIHVMAGANALEDGDVSIHCRRLGTRSSRSSSHSSTTTLRFPDRRLSASSIGRWKKPSCSACQPKQNSAARLPLIIGGASGIGREVALLLARKGAHVVVADFDQQGVKKVADEARRHRLS